MSDLVVAGVALLLALVIVALLWMLSEITRLRAENMILREQRDTWQKIASGEILVFREGDRDE